MNATAFCVPGEGATAMELFKLVVQADFPNDEDYEVYQEARWRVSNGMPWAKRTNLVILPGRTLTVTDLHRIAEAKTGGGY